MGEIKHCISGTKIQLQPYPFLFSEEYSSKGCSTAYVHRHSSLPEISNNSKNARIFEIVRNNSKDFKTIPKKPNTCILTRKGYENFKLIPKTNKHVKIILKKYVEKLQNNSNKSKTFGAKARKLRFGDQKPSEPLRSKVNYVHLWF